MKNKAVSLDPVMILFLGACPAVAAAGKLLSALGMGVAVLAVMLLSSLIIALIRKLIPQRVMIPACILIVTAVASAVSMLMNAFLPEIYAMLGVYAAVIAVNILVFSSAEKAGERSVGAVLADSLLSGLVFLAALLIMAAIREILGAGSFAGIALPFMKGNTIAVMNQSSGGLLVFAVLLAVINALRPAKTESLAGFAGKAAGIEGEVES